MANSMERLLAALQGQPSDRIPVFCNLLDQGAKELGITLQEYYTNGALVAEAQLKMRERYGYAKDGPPNVEDYVIKSFSDIETLVIPPDITSHPAFAAQDECLKILRSEL